VHFDRQGVEARWQSSLLLMKRPGRLPGDIRVILTGDDGGEVLKLIL